MSKLRLKIIEYLVVLAIIAVVLAILLPPAISDREPARRVICQRSLQQVGLALHQYHDKYGSFPPAYLTDANGRPMHSWRVLLLPFLGQQALYDDYRFDEPWDGPHNALLHERASEALTNYFSCPSDRSSSKKTTS